MLCVFTINSSTVLLFPGVSTLTVFSASRLVLSVVADDLDDNLNTALEKMQICKRNHLTNATN